MKAIIHNELTRTNEIKSKKVTTLKTEIMKTKNQIIIALAAILLFSTTAIAQINIGLRH